MTTSGGEIAIFASYHVEMGSLIVHVRDTGFGIAQESIKKLFSSYGMFDRSVVSSADQSLSRNDSAGLGLTISKLIIEKSGGSIMAESDGEGQGTLFIFSMKMHEVENGDGNGNMFSSSHLTDSNDKFRLLNRTPSIEEETKKDYSAFSHSVNAVFTDNSDKDDGTRPSNQLLDSTAQPSGIELILPQPNEVFSQRRNQALLSPKDEHFSGQLCEEIQPRGRGSGRGSYVDDSSSYMGGEHEVSS